MQLAALEREVGFALTERNGRRLALTPAGQVLAQHGHDITDLVSVPRWRLRRCARAAPHLPIARSRPPPVRT